MQWNWQLPGWPEFTYQSDVLRPLEDAFLLESGRLLGSFVHLGGADEMALRIELLSDEALETSRIEGEILNRESLQSSLRRHFGLATDKRKVAPAEQGVSEMLVDAYRHFESPLDQERLCRWQGWLMRGRFDLKGTGAYRVSPEPMQIVSGPLHDPRVHYEAPPSKEVPRHMREFLEWFNGSAHELPALTRAALAHLRFEAIHPFEDGNGRIGRTVAEWSLSRSVGRPLPIALSQTISLRKKAYYEELANANHTLEVTRWVRYFATTILDAQQRAMARLAFVIAKSKFFDRYRGMLNERQEKVLVRVFAAGPEGFAGGLSAGNYASISGSPSATVTRDLQDLVEKGALLRTGERKSTRYRLNLET